MKETLVIGLYEDTGQTFVSAFRGGSKQDALLAAAKEAGTAADQLIILGSVTADNEGRLTFETPGEENDNAAYASDLVEAFSDVNTV